MDKLREIKKIIKNKALQKTIKNYNIDENIFEMTEEDIHKTIVEELETKVNEYAREIDELNILLEKLRNKRDKESFTKENEEEYESIMKRKKYIVEKLKKNRKILSEDESIIFLVKQRKMHLRKARKNHEKVKELISQSKKKGVVCFRCRKKGHLISECKEILDGKDICFTCGSEDHNVHNCPNGLDYSNMPFATCFVCGEKGHLSSKCSINKDKGIYPKGGGCYECGSNEHLAKECPDKMLRLESIKEKEQKNSSENKKNKNKNMNFRLVRQEIKEKIEKGKSNKNQDESNPKTNKNNDYEHKSKNQDKSIKHLKDVVRNDEQKSKTVREKRKEKSKN